MKTLVDQLSSHSFGLLSHLFHCCGMIYILALSITNVVTILTCLTWLTVPSSWLWIKKHTPKSFDQGDGVKKTLYWLHDTHLGAVSLPHFTSVHFTFGIRIRIQYLHLSLGVSFVIYPNNWHNCKSHPTKAGIAQVTNSTAQIDVSWFSRLIHLVNNFQKKKKNSKRSSKYRTVSAAIHTKYEPLGGYFM